MGREVTQPRIHSLAYPYTPPSNPLLTVFSVLYKLKLMTATLKTPLAGNLNEIRTNDDILVLLD